MKSIQRVEQFIFQTPLPRLAGVLFAISLLKTGIWRIPNMEASRQIAQNPFVNPLRAVESHYLMWSWLGPFIAWLVRATGRSAFFALHLLFAVCFSGLF